MPRHLRVQYATPTDYERLAALCAQLGYPTESQVAAERLNVILANPAGEAILTAVMDERVVGWVHTQRVNFLGSEPFAEIGGLVVDEAVRGQGVGRALMAAAEEWARTAGLSAVKLRSNTLRGEAHAFYESIGYRRIKSQFTFHKDLEA